MGKINLRGKKIRLFFHTDLDGAISANLIQLFSGAHIVSFVPCPFQNYPKPDKTSPDVLDVFVDCRSRDRNEDVRIDHHASGEDEEYLKRKGVLLDVSFKSAVSLVAHYLGVSVDKQILEEMDKVDSGVKNVFSKFTQDEHTIHKILFSPALNESDYKNYEQFKDKLLGFMVKGFAVEDLTETPKGYEQKMEAKFRIVVEDIKKPNAPLIKLVHSPAHEGVFLEHIFTITDSDFFGHVLPYAQQHYYQESNKGSLGVYVVVGFRARNYEFDEQCMQIVKDSHPEPFQIFVSRSQANTTINIGNLIQEAKKITGIANGGGRDTVGGMNTNDKNKAIAALRFIIQFIEKNAP
ncbi:hypothetical protein JW707_04495 [Candidatus Woesearchaeota archaeon]|nr:hypothetical protein [Candidatus Woesearchaeota archaeon]